MGGFLLLFFLLPVQTCVLVVRLTVLDTASTKHGCTVTQLFQEPEEFVPVQARPAPNDISHKEQNIRFLSDIQEMCLKPQKYFQGVSVEMIKKLIWCNNKSRILSKQLSVYRLISVLLAVC